MEKRTKIVCTIGPASAEVATLTKMIRAGMNAARLNFSHGSHKDHARLIRHVRAAARKTGQIVTVVQDLQGPRIRLGEIKGKVVWRRGEEVILRGVSSVPEETPKVQTKGRIVPVTYVRLHRDVKKGHRILIEDGKLELRVMRVKGKEVLCTVVRGGEVKSHKGLNFPDSKLSIDPITEKDKEDIKFGLTQGVDYVVASFVSHERTIKKLRQLLGRRGSSVGIIAKIETAEALVHIEKIIDAADGVMIGRGDLALQIDYADVPLWQKRIITLCRERAKPVIVATQMMESMMKGRGSRPSRSDVSDVANAAVDHTDAVMTSGETATGDNPVEVVRTMAHIIEEIERSVYDDVALASFEKSDFGVAVRHYAEQKQARVILVEGAQIEEVVPLIARSRPEISIFVKTSNHALLRRLNVYWGVYAAPASWKGGRGAHLVQIKDSRIV